MSIASEISRITGNIADAYTAANSKGATMPVTQNSDNLASTIATISSGVTPTGTLPITTNGTYDVTNYANADVNVPSSAPTYYIERYGANGYLSTSRIVNPINLTGIHTIDVYSLAYAYTGDTYLTSLPDFSNIVKVSTQGLQGAFWGCTGVAGHVNMDKVEIIESFGMQYCFEDTKISSIGLKNLRTNGTNGLDEAFSKTKLKTMKFQSLTTPGTNGFRNTFNGCTDLEEVWFYALTNGGGNNTWFRTLYNCTNVTVHFPKNMQSTLSTYANITSGMNGTNTTILYDIITSLTGADSNTYARTEKDSTGTATAWTYNSTLYYTSGTTEPVVGDTIYSDAACTTSVTTVSAIA